MKTFDDLKDGDIVYVIHPEYIDDDFSHWIIEEPKIKSIYTLGYFLNGNKHLGIFLDNGYYFEPISNDTYHSGSSDENTWGKIADPRVEYLVDIKHINKIFDYKYIIKEMDINSREKYNLY